MTRFLLLLLFLLWSSPLPAAVSQPAVTLMVTTNGALLAPTNFFNTNATAVYRGLTNAGFTFGDGGSGITAAQATNIANAIVPTNVSSGTFASIASMVAAGAAIPVGSKVTVLSYWGTNSSGGGDFIKESGTATTNFGTIFAATGGGRLRRLSGEETNIVKMEWFGVVSHLDTTSTVSLFDNYLRAKNCVDVAPEQGAEVIVPSMNLPLGQQLDITNKFAWTIRGAVRRGGKGGAGFASQVPIFSYFGPTGGGTNWVINMSGSFITWDSVDIEVCTPVHPGAMLTNHADTAINIDQVAGQSYTTTGITIKNSKFVDRSYTNSNLKMIAISRTSTVNVEHTTIENCLFVNGGNELYAASNGVAFYQGSSANALNNTVEGCTFSYFGVGVHMVNGSIRIEKNLSARNYVDYRLDNASAPSLIAWNDVEDSGRVFVGNPTIPLTFSGNRISGTFDTNSLPRFDLGSSATLWVAGNDFSPGSYQVYTNDQSGGASAVSIRNTYPTDIPRIGADIFPGGFTSLGDHPLLPTTLKFPIVPAGNYTNVLLGHSQSPNALNVPVLLRAPGLGITNIPTENVNGLSAFRQSYQIPANTLIGATAGSYRTLGVWTNASQNELNVSLLEFDLRILSDGLSSQKYIYPFAGNESGNWEELKPITEHVSGGGKSFAVDVRYTGGQKEFRLRRLVTGSDNGALQGTVTSYGSDTTQAIYATRPLWRTDVTGSGTGATVVGQSSATPMIQRHGRVGIGTNNPTTTLDVEGNSRVNGAFILGPDGRYVGSIYGHLFHNSSDVGQMTLFPSGGLGLGASFSGVDPGANNLSVQGSFTLNGNIDLGASSYYIGGAAYGHSFGNSAQTAEIMRMFNSGGVGIGAAYADVDPGANNLRVQGNVQIAGVFTGNGSGLSNTVDFIAGSNVTIATNANKRSFTLSASGGGGSVTNFGDTTPEFVFAPTQGQITSNLNFQFLGELFRAPDTNLLYLMFSADASANSTGAVIYLTTSTNGGGTWSANNVVWTNLGTQYWSGEFAAGVDSNGRLYKINDRGHLVEAGALDNVCQISDDRGATWQRLGDVGNPGSPVFNAFYPYGNVIEQGGVVMFSTYCYSTTNSTMAATYAMRSVDRGTNWTPSLIYSNNVSQPAETRFLPFGQGVIQAYIRVEADVPYGRLALAESLDDGATWTFKGYGLNQFASNAQNPIGVSFDSGGNIVISYYDRQTGGAVPNGGLYLLKLPIATAANPTNWNTAAVTQIEPRASTGIPGYSTLLKGRDGSMLVAWHDNNQSGTQTANMRTRVVSTPDSFTNIVGDVRIVGSAHSSGDFRTALTIGVAGANQAKPKQLYLAEVSTSADHRPTLLFNGNNDNYPAIGAFDNSATTSLRIGAVANLHQNWAAWASALPFTLYVAGDVVGKGSFTGNGGGLSNAVVITASGGATAATIDGGRTYNIDVAGGGGSVTNFGVDAAFPNVATTNGNVTTIGSTAVVDSTDATSFPAIFDSATGALAPKTDGGLTYNATSGTLDSTVLTEGGVAVFNSSETPGGELGGTWAAPTIDDSIAIATPTLIAPIINGVVDFPDNARQIFNPGANVASLNVGAIAGDPDTPINGDLWYDSTANEMTARINGANVALGAGGGASLNHVLTALSTNNAQQTLTNILLQNQQGAVTDAQVPNNITVDLATLASTVTVVDGTDATSFVGIFDSATGSLATKTDGALLYNASSGALTAGSFVGAASTTLTGDDEAYDATGWNGDTSLPTKNALRDKIEALVLGAGGIATNGGTGVNNILSNLLVRTGSGVDVFDSNTGLLNDNSEVPSIDIYDREIINAAGSRVAKWDNVDFEVDNGITAQSLTVDTFNVTTANFTNMNIYTATGSVTVAVGGTLKVDTTSTGNVGSGEDNLISYIIPGSVLATNGQYLEFDVWGTCAANTNPKQIKIVYGATTLLDTTAVVLNGNDWRGHGKIVRTSATAQTATCEFTVGGTLLSAVNSTISDTTAPGETLSGTSVFKCTGTSTVAPNNDDIVQKGLVLKWHPGQ